MEVKITSKHKNASLHREEITFEARHEKTTPKRKEVVEKISALTGTKPEFVVIESLAKKFGTTGAIGKALVYESEKSLKETERKYLIERTTGKKPKEEKKEEPPKKEEKK